MAKFLEKINPMNWIEKIIIKKMAKRIIKKLPDLQEKGIEVINEYSEKIEKSAENLLEEIKITIVKHIEKFETK